MNEDELLDDLVPEKEPEIIVESQEGKSKGLVILGFGFLLVLVIIIFPTPKKKTTLDPKTLELVTKQIKLKQQGLMDNLDSIINANQDSTFSNEIRRNEK